VPGLVILPLAIVAVVLGARYRRNVERGNLPDSRLARLGYVFGGAGILVGAIQVCAFLYLLPVLLSPAAAKANEAAAISALRDIQDAQSRHMRLTGGYAESLEVLYKRGFLNPVHEESFRYHIEMTVSRDFKEFEVRAHPLKPEVSGDRHFFINHSGILRGSGSPEINRNSPPVTPAPRSESP
jgi:hypothetical protein